MRNMWTRIGVGALCIFAMGMMLITLLRGARESGRSALLGFLGAEDASAATQLQLPGAPATSAVLPIVASRRLAGDLARLAQLHGGPNSDMAFVLEGRRLGTIQRLSIRRAHRGQLPEVSLQVVITDPAEAGRLKECDLIPDHGSRLAGDDGFSCAGSDATGLVTVGSARLEPFGFTRPIRLTQDAVTEMGDGEPFEVSANADGQVRVTATGKDGGGVQVRSLGDGAAIRIDDALGRAIFRLLADSTGATMRMRGKDGRDIIRMDASAGKFSLTIDTTAAP